jgi:hypothetical protein
LSAIAQRCLDKSPQRRFGSGEELAGALDDFLSGRAKSAGRMFSWDHLADLRLRARQRWDRMVLGSPSRRAALNAAFFLLLAGAVALISWVFWLLAERSLMH